ncbi:MAG: hypothetical protein RRA15_02195 [bacterium]|nr:hypothetical protein [bacterium]MDT8365291.1 hypothetical protein [bacterium]
MIFPERNDLRDPEEFSLPRRSLLRILGDLEIAYCDPYDAFAAREDMEELFLARDSVHFTLEGHEVVRDALLACSEKGVVPLIPGRRHPLNPPRP